MRYTALQLTFLFLSLSLGAAQAAPDVTAFDDATQAKIAEVLEAADLPAYLLSSTPNQGRRRVFAEYDFAKELTTLRLKVKTQKLQGDATEAAATVLRRAHTLADPESLTYVAIHEDRALILSYNVWPGHVAESLPALRRAARSILAITNPDGELLAEAALRMESGRYGAPPAWVYRSQDQGVLEGILPGLHRLSRGAPFVRISTDEGLVGFGDQGTYSALLSGLDDSPLPVDGEQKAEATEEESEARSGAVQALPQ